MPKNRGTRDNDDGNLFEGLICGTAFTCVCILLTLSIIGWVRAITKFWGHLH